MCAWSDNQAGRYTEGAERAEGGPQCSQEEAGTLGKSLDENLTGSRREGGSGQMRSPASLTHIIGGPSREGLSFRWDQASCFLQDREKEHTIFRIWYCCSAAQLCPPLFDLMDCSPPGSSVHGTLQAKILEQVAISSPVGSSRPRH